ncbi:hypothetical protein Agabi119p4_4064 [Agaricus bisporus var. burnettii]|uniref:C2H2-type domain-containing protein n=1 Tax=Agaricus bisporus var. burnettii TaxID=192524 RepID=A0A8H7F2J9_AGABI|nr:hypothetical protein Agabi119p4_4064 [Agaricus bisporus var. burnettii]
MFGFLSRKLNPPPPSSGTTDSALGALSVPSPAAEPPITPSPPPANLITDPKPLHSLIASIPPQTFHAYALAHLIPPSQPLSPVTFPHIPFPTDPPSPKTLTALTNFFANLVPPPRLHCVRCHKWYFEVENADRSCLVPHSDESAEVERVGATGRSKGIGTEYETLWGCCGKTVEGDGDMGPPDGWCYEGKHTTDIKRARFRADSTLQDDKLTYCDRLRCHEPASSSPRASRSGANKRRRTLMEEADNEDGQSSVDGSTLSSSSNKVTEESTATTRKPKRARHSKSASLSEADKNSKEDDDTAMDVDTAAHVPATPKSPPRPRKPRKSGGTTTTTPGPKSTKTKAKSPLVSSFSPPSPSTVDNAPSQVNKEKSSLLRNRAVVEITTERDGSPRLSSSRLRKASNVSLSDAFKSDNDTQSEKEATTKSKPKSRARRNTVVDPTTTTTTTPKTPKATPRSKKSVADDSTTTPASSTKTPKSSSRSVKPKSSVASLKTTATATATANVNTAVPVSFTTRSGSIGKRGGKVLKLSEVIATSVEGEEQDL